MTTITLPSTPKPQTMSWRLLMPTQANVSSWTGKRQVVASGRGWWECDFNLPPIVGSTNINAWRAFVALARGTANDFYIPVDPTAQSALSNTVRTNGTDQTGRAIATDGWPNSSTVLQAGQFVTINDQLLQVTSDVTSNGSGQATIAVEPPVRQPVADNSVVEYKNPFCKMYMTEEPNISVEPGYVYNISLRLREAF
jgi:hypothetical protein